jgi:hypothetical protein
MTENNTPRRRRGVTLRTPEDVRRAIQRITSTAFQEGSELEHAGKISQLLGCWLKAFEIDKLSEIEKRLKQLEETQEQRK